MAGLLRLCLFVGLAFAATEPPRKQLGGPPSEFPDMELPSIAQTFQVESSVMYDLTLQSLDATTVGTTTDLIVDSSTYFQFSLSSPIASYLVYKLVDPTGASVDLSNPISEQFPLGDSGTNTVPTQTWTFENPKVGTWVLTIVSNAPLSAQQLLHATSSPQVALLLFNYNPTVQIDVAVAELSLLTGNSVGLVTQMDDATGGTITAASMDVTMPDGTFQTVPMHDDGLHLDGEANDGLWGGVITATQAGTYAGQALVSGTTAGGQAFVRSAQVPFAVVDDHTTLTGTAAATQVAGRTSINLGVSGASTTKYRAYAEVYGTSNSGAQIPVAWISSLVNTVQTATGYTVTLELDNNWIAMAQAVAPFELQSVSLQSIDYGTLISLVPKIPLNLDKASHKAVLSLVGKTVQNITEEMRFGVRPAHLLRPEEYDDSTPAPLLLSHGYCTTVNPWQASSTQWENPHFFQDFSANRLNDEFALLLNEFASSVGIANRFNGIGHSQGGLALTHLLNYYWTGLDSSSGRRIQSVGSPYQGNSVAGSSANLGSLFGVGCGPNDNMTPQGAKEWMNGISMAVRQQVYYYTTTYEQGKFFGDSCSTAANAVLKWPNDGVTELTYAQFPGANNMGNTEKQCHTTELNYIAQYFDTSRNQLMQNAAF